ncbi:MAG: EAL domain-containing protein, partial [Deltaproteobacteria bacterium]|nr:EAL domain-containing protein [Deltaproteobacteria bacterium]
DNFKEINDSLGHDAGDLLLKYAAERIKGCLRDEDTVARLSGDEFIIILTDVADLQNITKVAKKILDVISRPFELKGRELFITVSIGISIYPSDAVDIDTLIKNADIAMYRAKEQGKNNYQIYSDEMNDRAHKRMDLTNSLRKALEQKEFKVHYQPKMDMATGKMVGIEALVRWQHPDRGCIAAGEFISAAEESGVIIPLGQFVLKTACRQNKLWQDMGLARIPVSVNLSTRQFQQKNLVEMVALVLEETALAGHHLELEIPESAIMQDMDSAALTMKRLKELKVLISISDFGTGYSSMGYIKYLPIDGLNIAGSFIKDITNNPDDKAITSAMISIARSLQLKAIATGVETDEQKEMLQSLHCHEIQGYIFSRPLPPEDVENILANNSGGGEFSSGFFQQKM